MRTQAQKANHPTDGAFLPHAPSGYDPFTYSYRKNIPTEAVKP